MPKKVLFINQEIAPFVPETPMSLLGREMSARMQESGYEIRTFMPKWGIINERRGQLHEVIRLSGVNIIVRENDHPLIIKVASLPSTRVQVYFIDNEEFFARKKMLLDEAGEPFKDNGERALFFCKGVLETVKKLRWTPDVIVCHGWMSLIVPIYLKLVYGDEPCFAGTKVIVSLSADEFAGELEEDFKRSIEYKEVTTQVLKIYRKSFNYEELCKMAIDYSDGVVCAESLSQTLKKRAKTKGVPLKECGEDIVESYKTLIDDIFK